MYFYDVRKAIELIDSAHGDVNGDGVIDEVLLIGYQTQDTPFVQNITLVIQDGATHELYSTPLVDNVGYNPTLFLGDFTGDAVDEILISIATGGSGGIMNEFIYSFVHNRFNLIFNSNEYNDYYQYTVNYEDDAKVRVISEVNQQQYVIDLSDRDPQYLNEIYDANGNLIEPIEGWVNPLSGLYPVDFDMDGVYELLVYQRIAGRYNADALGYVLNTLAWDGNQFALSQQFVAIYGADL
ncbi:VCBS repeat-containing protein [Alkalibacillus haloalkaliphilus]|uniref:VCBS repeat-containing protein n=1 Tax=Alkalibacillus haloalkaliphilus TaxID=94136 RepID=UPI002936C395|nr:VCBS repeat-containing protein [Alkalibacillus haloalkaliphilus]MDV2581533.1 VCBS repeat-containing protein [Alkalibacillus haloalkaliphilus]